VTGQIQESALVLSDQIGRDEIAGILVDLIKNKRELRRATLEVVQGCPNVVRKG